MMACSNGGDIAVLVVSLVPAVAVIRPGIFLM